MARKFMNEKGFTIYEVKMLEILKLGGYGICDRCNSIAEKGYLIPILNMYYCPKCYEDWLKRTEYYEEDRFFENRKIEYYDSVLNLEEKWQEN